MAIEIVSIRKEESIWSEERGGATNDRTTFNTELEQNQKIETLHNVG